MSWGVGLASFMTGFSKGVGLGNQIAESRQRQEMNEIKLGKVKRAEGKQRKMEAMGLGATTRYREEVAAGKVDPADADEWFAKNYAPVVEQFFIENGDLENAARWDKWANDTKTKGQIKSMGIMLGHFNNAIETGNFDKLDQSFGKFYNSLPDDVRGGAKFDDFSVTKDAAGKITGISATFKQPDGKTNTMQWSDVGSFAKVVQGLATPEQLYAQTMATESAKAKSQADIKEYAAKKGIDLRDDITRKRFGLDGKKTDPAETYRKTRIEVEKNSFPGQDSDPDKDTRKILDDARRYGESVAPGLGGASGSVAPAAAGAPAPGGGTGGSSAGSPVAPPAPQRIIVDTRTGKPVQPPASDASAQAKAQPQQPQGNVEAPQLPTPRPQRAPGIGVPVRPQRPPYGNPLEELHRTGQVSRTSSIGVGDLVSGAGAVAPMGELDRINAARRASGLPPLTEQQAAEVLVRAGGVP